jgi:hypothetical protein
MAKTSKSKTSKKRVKVKNIAEKERGVSADDLKNVKGGVDGADFLTWQRQMIQKGEKSKITVDPSDPSVIY